jgi:glutaredoxin
VKPKALLSNIAMIAATAALAAFLGSNLPQLIKQWRGPFTSGDFSSHVANQPYKLTMYGTTSCPHCASARAYLKQAGIAFNDVMIDQSPAARDAYRQLNQGGVPVLVAENKLVVGFSQAVYEQFIRTVNSK